MPVSGAQNKGRTEVSERLPAGLVKGLQHQLDLQLRTPHDPPCVLTSELNGKPVKSTAEHSLSEASPRAQTQGKSSTLPGPVELLESSSRAC